MLLNCQKLAATSNISLRTIQSKRVIILCFNGFESLKFATFDVSILSGIFQTNLIALPTTKLNLKLLQRYQYERYLSLESRF